jgi:hypothetical protein
MSHTHDCYGEKTQDILQGMCSLVGSVPTSGHYLCGPLPDLVASSGSFDYEYGFVVNAVFFASFS